MIKKTIFKYLLISLSTAALCGAEFAGMKPCGAGFAAALVFYGLPQPIILPVYAAFSLLFDFSLEGLAYTASVCACIFAASLVCKKAKARMPVFSALFFLSQFSLLARHSELGYVRIMVWAVLAVGMFVAAVCFLRPVIVSALKYKLLETELVCGGILLICASLGLCAMRVYGFDAAYLLAAFTIPFAVAAGSVSGAVGIAMCMGMGVALGGTDVSIVAFFAFSALVAAIFNDTPRPISSLSTVAAFILVSYLFDSPPLWQRQVCFAVGALAFSLVPKRAVKRVRELLFSPVAAMAARGMIKRSAMQTGNNLLGASRIFADMRIAMEQVPEPPSDGFLEQKVCADCPRYGGCKQNPEYREALEKMERRSAVLGRASVSEVPQILSVCDNLPALISAATDDAVRSHERMLGYEARKEGRKIVARQLGLMSEVLRQMGDRVKAPVTFDEEKEKKLSDELAYRGAAVPEVIVSGENVSVVLGCGDLGREQVTECVGKVMHCAYDFAGGSADVIPGYELMQFTKAPRYDVEFWAAGSAKEGVSGDNHSFTYLGGDRFMMALCDGMGSGEQAEKASETAIELVESFFRAGLDSMSAVECVNKFLTLNECDRFSTLDITVIDLNSGNAEIIKLSSPSTVIKSDSGVRAVSSSSLPMGVFEEVSCGHARVELCGGDEVIMATDGITDALGSVEEFISAAATSQCADPKAQANNILERATAAEGGKLRDDATVLCAKIHERKGFSAK